VKVIWHQGAELELYEQVGFIARDKPLAAEAILDTRLASAGRLGDFPDMGVQGRAKGTRELVVPHLPYILVYRKRVPHVEILNLLNTSQDR
jgi:toxin ParE1/3/4